MLKRMALTRKCPVEAATQFACQDQSSTASSETLLTMGFFLIDISVVSLAVIATFI